MKKTLLLFAAVMTQITIAQTLPEPAYKHSFSQTLSASNFSVSTSRISLTTDRTNIIEHAAQLEEYHGFLKLDISNQKVALLNQGTISMWYKYEGTGESAFGTDKPLVYWSNGHQSYSEGLLLARTSNNSRVKVASYQNSTTGTSSNSAISFPSVSAGWNHFTVSWKFGYNGYVKGYLNGVNVVSISHNNILTENGASNYIYFTGFDDTFSSSLHGKIDEIYVFTQALTDTEVYDVYQNGFDDMCIVNIPDANFKNVLLNHNPVIDTNGDGKIQCIEASAFTGIISAQYSNISDLTGIEAFTAATSLVCTNNQLTSLDVSANTQLEILYCENNQLTSLDISTNTALIHVRCDNNQLTALDVSTNTALLSLSCNNNQLTNLDISTNTQITALSCNNNQLTGLNVANGINGYFFYLNADNNSNLSCIQVDDSAYSNTYWTDQDFFIKPTGAIWSNNCLLSTSDLNTSKINIYPNPTIGLVSISEMANVTVFDIQGRKITERKNTTSFDLSSQIAGIYFVQITTEKGTETVKIIKK